MSKKEEKEFYDDDYFDEAFNEARERVERLKELEERENFLKREKTRLIREKPWFKKPQNLIAIFGVLLPIIVSIFVSFYSEDKKELSIEYLDIEPLIVESSNFGNKVSIKYDSTEIKNISRIKFKILNSGDLDVEKRDFIDGPLTISLLSESNKNLKIYKVLNLNDAGQQNAVLRFEPFNENGSFSYLPSLLNKGDEVIIDAYLIDPENFKITMSGKIKNGVIKGPKFSNPDKLDFGFKTFILSISSFFNYKWFTISFFVILFIITALSSIYILAKAEDDDPLWLSKLMGFTVGMIAIMNIVIIISTFIYQ